MRIALVVIVGQLPKLLGFSVDASSLVGEVGEIATVRAGDIDAAPPASASVPSPSSSDSASGSPMPGVLVAVVARSSCLRTRTHRRLPVVGALPQGLPRRRSAVLDWGDVGELAAPRPVSP